MLLVRQVALPMLRRALRGGSCLSMMPCFALWSCFPMEPCGFPAGSYSPMVPCFALWSCFPMVLCAVPGGSCFPMVLCAFPAGSCLSMVSPAPAENLHATAPAERQPLPHRLPLRTIPPAALRLRVLPFTRDMVVHGLCGRVPDSTGSICPQGVDTPLRSKLLTAVFHLKHHLLSCSCSLARRQPHPAQVRQIASQTGVLPRRMRFVAGRGHCSSKSPRARILVLGTSGAHWPARWPRFELTERVVKSQLSGY